MDEGYLFYFIATNITKKKIYIETIIINFYLLIQTTTTKKIISNLLNNHPRWIPKKKIKNHTVKKICIILFYTCTV